jgi:uncharacterized NAD(P)/FAD-binding protein YdhS
LITDTASIAVIGAGFTGTIVALQLNRMLAQRRRIVLCERAPNAGQGAAYGTRHPDHLLNVRAANMSAFPDDPGNFATWLQGAATENPCNVHQTEAGIFASRALYGQYLSSLLSRAMAESNRIELAPEVVDAVPEARAVRLHFADGATCPAAAAVLAIGNLPSPDQETAFYRPHPWADDATSGLQPGLPVLIIGTGLTTVDLAIEIQERGFPGPVIAVSRRGLLTNRHAVAAPWPAPEFSPAERSSLLALLLRLRKEAAQAKARGIDWRGVVDSIRPLTAELWRGLTERDRSRFLRHLRPFWDVHRHRMAPPVAAMVEKMRETGFLQIHRGRILQIAGGTGGAKVDWLPRGAREPQQMTVQRVINATGVENAARSADPLMRNLLRRGLVRLDRYGIGVDVTDALQIGDNQGRAAPNFWALGPIVRGIFWECTAVPDIRIQAEQVARHAAERIELAEAT